MVRKAVADLSLHYQLPSFWMNNETPKRYITTCVVVGNADPKFARVVQRTEPLDLPRHRNGSKIEMPRDHTAHCANDAAALNSITLRRFSNNLDPQQLVALNLGVRCLRPVSKQHEVGNDRLFKLVFDPSPCTKQLEHRR